MTTVTSADGTAINVNDHGGDGPPVLLVHGITESSGAWDPVVERLTPTNRVITMDLRGHGASGTADRYDLEAMAGDVVAVATELGVAGSVHLVGHSLGGAVVSAVGAAADVASVVNVDQSLQLGAFKGMLAEVEAMLRDENAFPAVIDGMFEQLAGPMISGDAMGRVNAIRRPDQQVVLGVWDLLFSMSSEEVNAVVEGALAGYAGRNVPYLTVFGADPGPEYEAWLGGHIAGATTELWADHGHYPHLVDPDRFVARLHAFWG
ncbi:MAG: alpha/beta fold hydrolase [Actinomycetota bacterium]